MIVCSSSNDLYYIIVPFIILFDIPSRLLYTSSVCVIEYKSDLFVYRLICVDVFYIMHHTYRAKTFFRLAFNSLCFS